MHNCMKLPQEGVVCGHAQACLIMGMPIAQVSEVKIYGWCMHGNWRLAVEKQYQDSRLPYLRGMYVACSAYLCGQQSMRVILFVKKATSKATWGNPRRHSLVLILLSELVPILEGFCYKHKSSLLKMQIRLSSIIFQSYV